MAVRGWTAARRAGARAGVALSGVLAILFLVVAPAQAHATLLSSTPAQGSVLAKAPAQVSLHFSEQVGTALGSVTVLDAAGGNHTDGGLLHPFNQSSDIAVLLKPSLANGTYLVVWRVVAADSHPTAGSFSFSVGNAGAIATADTSVNPDSTVAALLGFGRLLGFLGVAAFFGGLSFIATCWPGGRSSRVATRTLQTGWALAFGGAAAALLLEGPYGTGRSLAHALDWSLLEGVVKTRYGTALLARVVLLLAAAALTPLALRSRRWLVGFAVAWLATLTTFPFTGHPSVGTLVPLAVTSDVVHLTAMCVWLGGLLQLAVVVLPDEEPEVVRPAAQRFSRLAMGSVVVLIATGSYQSWREAGIAGDLTSTHYGRLLLIKIAIVAAVLLVAEFSRRWVGAAGSPAVKGFAFSVALETAMVVVVLAVTSLLVSGVPARSDYRPSSDLHLAAGPTRLELSVRPTASRVVDVRIDSTDASGRPLDLHDLTLSLALAHPVTGQLNVRLAAIGPTQFQATDVELPYTGRWAVTLIAHASDVDQYTATTDLTIR